MGMGMVMLQRIAMPMIKSEFVIEGAIRALEAAQDAIRDAVKEYRDTRYPTATIMGAVAAEHLSRCGWLFTYAAMIGDAEIDCGSFAADFDKGLKEGDAGFEKKCAEIFKFVDKMRKRGGSSYHELREQAQYVERLDNCAGWRRPRAVKPSEVHDFLLNVANSYGALLWFGPFKNPNVLAAAKNLGVDQALIDTNGLWPPREGDAE